MQRPLDAAVHVVPTYALTIVHSNLNLMTSSLSTDFLPALHRANVSGGGGRGHYFAHPMPCHVLWWLEADLCDPDDVNQCAHFRRRHLYTHTHTPKASGELQVTTAEIGDTWIHGIQSDPFKTKAMRAMMRARTKCANSPASICDVNTPAMQNFTRLLMKNAEHTWGKDVKSYLGHDPKPCHHRPPCPYPSYKNDWTNGELDNARNHHQYYCEYGLGKTICVCTCTCVQCVRACAPFIPLSVWVCVGGGGVKRAMSWHGTPLDRGGCVGVCTSLLYYSGVYYLYLRARLRNPGDAYLRIKRQGRLTKTFKTWRILGASSDCGESPLQSKP